MECCVPVAAAGAGPVAWALAALALLLLVAAHQHPAPVDYGTISTDLLLTAGALLAVVVTAVVLVMLLHHRTRTVLEPGRPLRVDRRLEPSYRVTVGAPAPRPAVVQRKRVIEPVTLRALGNGRR